jgi:hypothetical protein
MSTDVVTFATSETTIRYREQYVSEGLNKKLAVAMPWGTYRGFKLVPEGATDRILTIEADPTYSDHVAVYQSSTGYSLTVRRTGGDFDIDLTGYSNVTIYVTIYVSYSVGATTTATIRTYTEAEFAVAPEKDEVIVLGKVDVPVSGIIAASEVSGNERRMAWQNKTSEQVAWMQILRNSGFEFADVTSTEPLAAMYWRQEAVGGTATLGPDDTDPYSGDKHMVLNYTSGAINWNLTQYTQGIPLSEGQRFRIKFFKKMVQAATAGSFEVSVAYTTTSGGTIPSGALATLDTTLDASYEEFDQIFEVPSGSGVVSLFAVSISGTGMTFGSGGDAIRIDDVQVWLEASAENPYLTRDMQGEPMFMALHLTSPVASFGDIGDQPMLDVPGGNNAVRLVRSDLQDAAAAAPTSLEVTGGLSEVGSRMVHDASQALTSRFQGEVADSGVSQWTLLCDGYGPITTSRIRLYIYASTNEVVETINASWNGSQWERDTGSYSSTMRRLQYGGVTEWRWHDSGSASPWTTWDNSYEIDIPNWAVNVEDIRQRWLNTTAISNPLHTTAPWANTIYAKNIVKSWGYLVTDGAAGYTTTDGFNYAASFNGNDVRIDFQTAMANGTYAVAATIGGTTNPWVVQINNISTTGFDIAMYDAVVLSSINLQAVPATLFFIQVGQQNT